MADLYERIEKLCKDRGVSITEMCRQSGAARGSLTDLKMGRSGGLSVETLEKLMKYFNVSFSELMGETEKAPSEDGAELAEYLEDLRQRPETRALLEASRGMTRDQVEKMAEFAKMLRGGGNE